MNLKFIVVEDGNIQTKMVYGETESDFSYKEFVVQLYKGSELSDSEFDEKIGEDDKVRISKLVEELRDVIAPPQPEAE